MVGHELARFSCHFRVPALEPNKLKVDAKTKLPRVSSPSLRFGVLPLQIDSISCQNPLYFGDGNMSGSAYHTYSYMRIRTIINFFTTRWPYLAEHVLAHHETWIYKTPYTSFMRSLL